ncbi:hypothetical protein BC830DRAFT_255976 [Chytriomyces sp. MP71]|nr:hypothetical protein BC830DRAFT_255976 [Chytriomyces sp. MP71]
MTQFNETAQIKYGDNVEGIESSALSNDLNDAPFAPTIAKSPTSLPVGNSSVVSKPTSTPRGQGPRTESTTTEIPQTQGEFPSLCFCNQVPLIWCRAYHGHLLPQTDTN